MTRWWKLEHSGSKQERKWEKGWIVLYLVFIRHVTILSRQDSLDPVVYHHLKFLNCLTDVDGGLQTS